MYDTLIACCIIQFVHAIECDNDQLAHHQRKVDGADGVALRESRCSGLLTEVEQSSLVVREQRSITGDIEHRLLSGLPGGKQLCMVQPSPCRRLS